jgi:hypothetical protein
MAGIDSNTSSQIRGKTDWGATWAGVFTFAAIWSTFEMLGIALLGSSPGPGSHMNPGLAIWTIVLSLIAMYVAGHETGRLAQVAEKIDGIVHGMMMFGLSVVAMLVLAALGTGMIGGSLNIYLLNQSPAMRWTIFASLILGWLAAMIGASGNTGGRTMKAVDNVRDIRPAA